MQYDDYFKSYVGVSKETVEQLKKKIKLDTVDIKKNVFDVFDVSIFKWLIFTLPWQHSRPQELVDNMFKTHCIVNKNKNIWKIRLKFILEIMIQVDS